MRQDSNKFAFEKSVQTKKDGPKLLKEKLNNIGNSETYEEKAGEKSTFDNKKYWTELAVEKK